MPRRYSGGTVGIQISAAAAVLWAVLLANKL